MQENVSVKLGKRIIEIRKEKKLSQQDLAQKTHYSQCVISRIERGERDMGIKELQVFSKVLGKSMVYFLSDL